MFKWAIRDKKKFATLLDDVKEFVQQLRDITQAAADLESQRRALKAEVSAISNIETLEVLEEATAEDDSELSDVASQRILQLTNGSVVGSEQNQSLFTESIYHTARTYARTQDLRFELDTVYESMKEVNLGQWSAEEYENPAEPPVSTTEKKENDESDLAFNQRNNLKMIQEQDKQQFAQKIFGSPETQRIISPHKEFLEQKLHNLTVWDLLASSRRRVWIQLREFYRNSTPLVSVRPENDNLRMLSAAIQGPSGSAYEGGVFFMSILIPRSFPFQPPLCYFLTPIFHPNVAQGGEVLLDILSNKWSPIWTLEQLLTAFVSLLGDPDWNGSCRMDVSFIYNKDPVGFNAMSRVLTQRYAGQSKPPEKLFQDHEREILNSFVTQQISPITSEATRDWLKTKTVHQATVLAMPAM